MSNDLGMLLEEVLPLLETSSFSEQDSRDFLETVDVSNFSHITGQIQFGDKKKEIKEDIGPHDYSSTQFNIEGKLKEDLLKYSFNIVPDLLAEKGVESTPYITIKYGLTIDSPERIKDLVKNHGPVKVKLGKTEVFETKNGDCLIVKVEGKDVHDLHTLLLQNLPNTENYPEYKPHITLAYLKQGTAKGYEGDKEFQGKEITFDKFYFCPKEGDPVEIDLEKNLEEAVSFINFLPGSTANLSQTLESLAQERNALILFDILEAAEHAPKGGISIGGKKFKGGQFIPKEVMAKATKAEKAELKAKKEGKKAPPASKAPPKEKYHEPPRPHNISPNQWAGYHQAEAEKQGKEYVGHTLKVYGPATPEEGAETESIASAMEHGSTGKKWKIVTWYKGIPASEPGLLTQSPTTGGWLEARPDKSGRLIWVRTKVGNLPDEVRQDLFGSQEILGEPTKEQAAATPQKTRNLVLFYNRNARKFNDKLQAEAEIPPKEATSVSKVLAAVDLIMAGVSKYMGWSGGNVPWASLTYALGSNITSPERMVKAASDIVLDNSADVLHLAEKGVLAKDTADLEKAELSARLKQKDAEYNALAALAAKEKLRLDRAKQREANKKKATEAVEESVGVLEDAVKNIPEVSDWKHGNQLMELSSKAWNNLRNSALKHGVLDISPHFPWLERHEAEKLPLEVQKKLHDYHVHSANDYLWHSAQPHLSFSEKENLNWAAQHEKYTHPIPGLVQKFVDAPTPDITMLDAIESLQVLESISNQLLDERDEMKLIQAMVDHNFDSWFGLLVISAFHLLSDVSQALLVANVLYQKTDERAESDEALEAAVVALETYGDEDETIGNEFAPGLEYEPWKQ